MSDNTTGRMGGPWQSAIIPNTTPVAIVMNGAPLPCTVTLKSAAAGRLIEIATDGGVEYFQPTLDYTSSTSLVVSITTPISHVRLTGVTADSWSIR